MELLAPNDDDIELDFEADLRAQDAWRESQLMQETGGLGSMARGILRPGGRHTVVCKHWLRDLCMKGDKCDFLHQYDLARMPECPQWARFGKCPDNDCDFRHDTEKMECQKYKFGFCKLGSQCRMRHDKLSRAYLPETVPDWYLKEIIPNIFDFVPALPEEAVRVTMGPESSQHTPNLIVPPQMWPVTPQPPTAFGGDSAWAAPVAPSWGAPVAPAYPKPGVSIREKIVVDLTEERPAPARTRGERLPPKRNPVPERREPPERRERLPSQPRREPDRRERHISSPPRARDFESRRSPRREEEWRRSPRRDDELRRDRARREAERPRARSRSYERRRDDRGRPRR